MNFETSNFTLGFKYWINFKFNMTFSFFLNKSSIQILRDHNTIPFFVLVIW